jgi:hypothetical protein
MLHQGRHEGLHLAVLARLVLVVHELAVEALEVLQ